MFIRLFKKGEITSQTVLSQLFERRNNLYKKLAKGIAKRVVLQTEGCPSSLAFPKAIGYNQTVKITWRSFRFGLATLIFAALSVFFFYVYYIRYYAWRNCFNELGRCFNPDESGQVYTTSGFVWIIPTLLFSLFFIINLARLLIHIKRMRTVSEQDES